MSDLFAPLLSRTPGITVQRLAERVRSFQGLSLLVLGDFMLDEYVWGEVTRVSPEAPVPVVEARDHTYGLGGAGNVVNNVMALGGQVTAVGVIGNDAHGTTLTQELVDAGADATGLLRDPERPTTSKMRVVARSQQNNQQIVRIDRESREKIRPELVAALHERAFSALDTSDAVLISDYNKGLLTPSLSLPLIEACRKAGKPVIINPKPSNSACLNGSTLVSINVHEATVAALTLPASEWEEGPPGELNAQETVEDVGRRLRRFFGCETLFITQGARGVTLFSENDVTHLPAIPAEVYDGTGAGDTVVSVAAMTLASGGCREEAAILGNAGGAIKVHKLGAVAVSSEELLTLLERGDILK